MQNINLPPGCLIRQAKQKDILKLLFLPTTFSEQNRNFHVWTTSLLKFSYICFILIILLPLIALFNYVINQKLLEYLTSYASASDTWRAKLAILLYGSSIGFSTGIGETPNVTGIAFLLFINLLLFLILVLIIIRLICLETCVVECNRHIVGVAKLLRRPGRIILRNLYVTPAYRHQGIDAALVNYIKQQFSKPIYLASLPELVPYFISLGFIRISSDRLPYIITSDRLFSSTATNELVPMVTDNTLTPSIASEITANILLNFTVADCAIFDAQARDVSRIRSFLFRSSTSDFYLPFGIDLSVITTFLALLLAIIIILDMIRPIFFIVTKIQLSFNLLDNYLHWIIICSLFSFIIFRFIGNIWSSQNFSQYWLLEYRQKLIGYTRISQNTRYSILHHLYIDARLKAAFEAYFIEQILQSTNKPVLVACNYNNVRFYSDLGFIPIPIQNLPKRLRFGARINLLWGGMNLVHPNN